MTVKEAVDREHFFQLSSYESVEATYQSCLSGNSSSVSVWWKSGTCYHKVVDATSVNQFKNRLDKFWQRYRPQKHGLTTAAHHWTSTSTSNFTMSFSSVFFYHRHCQRECRECKCILRARIPNNFAEFAGLIHCCYTNCASKVHCNVPFSDGKNSNIFAGGI